jgi:hypothetical protein
MSKNVYDETKFFLNLFYIPGIKFLLPEKKQDHLIPEKYQFINKINSRCCNEKVIVCCILDDNNNPINICAIALNSFPEKEWKIYCRPDFDKQVQGFDQYRFAKLLQNDLDYGCDIDLMCLHVVSKYILGADWYKKLNDSTYSIQKNIFVEKYYWIYAHFDSFPKTINGLIFQLIIEQSDNTSNINFKMGY